MKKVLIAMVIVLLLSAVADARDYLTFGRNPMKPGGLHDCDLQVGQSFGPLETDTFIIMEGGSREIISGTAPAGTPCLWQEIVSNDGKKYKKLLKIKICGNVIHNEVLIPLPMPQVQTSSTNVVVNISIPPPQAAPLNMIPVRQPVAAPYVCSVYQSGGMYFYNQKPAGSISITANGGNATGGNATATGGNGGDGGNATATTGPVSNVNQNGTTVNTTTTVNH